MERHGRIVAVCTSSQDGVPKIPREMAVVADYGFEGDYHCKALRKSFKFPYLQKANTDRHITIVGKEVLDEMNQELGIALEPGSLAENILTEGLGNLSDVPDGATVRIYNVQFQVTEQNVPCRNLTPYHPQLVKKIYGKRGLLCAVVSGQGSMIEPNDPITIHW